MKIVLVKRPGLSRIKRWLKRYYDDAFLIFETGTVAVVSNHTVQLTDACGMEHASGSFVVVLDLKHPLTACQITKAKEFLNRHPGLMFYATNSELVFNVYQHLGIRLLERTELKDVTPTLLSRSPLLHVVNSFELSYEQPLLASLQTCNH